MTREELKTIFKMAKDSELDICVAVTIPNQEDLEYIINKNSSLNNKLEYYLKAYNENCVHSMNDQIKIVDAFCIDFNEEETIND